MFESDFDKFTLPSLPFEDKEDYKEIDALKAAGIDETDAYDTEAQDCKDYDEIKGQVGFSIHFSS